MTLASLDHIYDGFNKTLLLQITLSCYDHSKRNLHW